MVMRDVITDEICMWTIFDNPLDAPGFFVMRLFIGERPSNTALQFDTLEEARAVLLRIYPDLVCIPRSPHDEPHIVETWL